MPPANRASSVCMPGFPIHGRAITRKKPISSSAHPVEGVGEAGYSICGVVHTQESSSVGEDTTAPLLYQLTWIGMIRFKLVGHPKDLPAWIRTTGGKDLMRGSLTEDRARSIVPGMIKATLLACLALAATMPGLNAQ